MSYPIDSEGFAVPSTDFLADMKKYNLIVVSVLDEKEQYEAQNALWKAMGPHVTADPTTWETSNWPDPAHPFLSTSYATCETSFRNRVHPKLTSAFMTLYGTKDIVSTIDFWGVKRATLIVTEKGVINRSDWRLNPLRLHWDVNILEYVHQTPRYQCLIALNENSQSTGSFAYVPQSATRLGAWIAKYRKPDQEKYVPKSNPWQYETVRLPLRAGNAVIWDMGVAHSNFSNYGTEPRLTQYCRMVPRDFMHLEAQSLPLYWKENPQLCEKIKTLEWSEDQKRMLGF